MIYLNLWLLPIRFEKTNIDKIYYDKNTLTPLYNEKQKKLSLKKLRNDLKIIQNKNNENNWQKDIFYI